MRPYLAIAPLLFLAACGSGDETPTVTTATQHCTASNVLASAATPLELKMTVSLKTTTTATASTTSVTGVECFVYKNSDKSLLATTASGFDFCQLSYTAGNESGTWTMKARGSTYSAQVIAVSQPFDNATAVFTCN